MRRTETFCSGPEGGPPRTVSLDRGAHEPLPLLCGGPGWVKLGRAGRLIKTPRFRVGRQDAPLANGRKRKTRPEGSRAGHFDRRRGIGGKGAPIIRSVACVRCRRKPTKVQRIAPAAAAAALEARPALCPSSFTRPANSAVRASCPRASYTSGRSLAWRESKNPDDRNTRIPNIAASNTVPARARMYRRAGPCPHAEINAALKRPGCAGEAKVHRLRFAASRHGRNERGPTRP
jgi:hypothetical protein